MSKGLKRRNFFQDQQIENLHLKVKYGKNNSMSNPIAHDFQANFHTQTLPPVARVHKNQGNTYNPPVAPVQPSNPGSKDRREDGDDRSRMGTSMLG